MNQSRVQHNFCLYCHKNIYMVFTKVKTGNFVTKSWLSQEGTESRERHQLSLFMFRPKIAYRLLKYYKYNASINYLLYLLIT